MKRQLLGIIIGFLVVSGLLVTPTLVAAQGVNPIDQAIQAQEDAALNGNQNLQNTFTNPVSGVSNMPFISTTIQILGGGVEGVADNGEVIYSRGALQTTGTAIAWMYRQPAANTQTYIADLMNSANIAQPAYAQGLGFEALSPVLDVWKTFRNIAYVFFILVFLVIGFLIMLRRKVGQAAVTAQQAIPQIVVALLAVTFSYAIAALMIDMMFVIMFLIAGLFGAADKLDLSIFELGYTLVTGAADSAYKMVSGFVENIFNVPLLDDLDVLEGGAGVLAAFVFAVAMFFGVFRLFLELAKTYVSLIVSIIMAPILLMTGAIPGRNPFWGWIKNLVGNLSAFPTVLVVLVIFDKLTVGYAGDASGGFQPPFLFGSSQADVITFVIGLGLLLGLTDAVKKVKQMFGAQDGAFGDILKSGFQSSKAAVPLAGRLALGGASGLIGGTLAGGKEAARIARTGVPFREKMSEIGDAAWKGSFAKQTDDSPAGAASKGVRVANWISRSMGANSPDIVNPVNRYLDSRYDPASAKREQRAQEFEDWVQRVGANTGGIGNPQSKP